MIGSILPLLRSIPDSFFWGAGASVALEVIALSETYQKAGCRIPARYSRCGYYFVRSLVAMIAGGMCLAYEVEKAILCIHIGVSTPLILQTFAKSPLAAGEDAPA